VSEVETSPTMSMVADQAAAAAASALVSASGLAASASAPAAAPDADFVEGTDVAFELVYGQHPALLVLSESLAAVLVESQGGSADDADAAWSVLTELVDVAGRAAGQRVDAVVDGLGNMDDPRPLVEGAVARIGAGLVSRVEIEVDETPTGWLMWVAGDELAEALAPRSEAPAVIDSIEYPELGQGATASAGADISFLADVTMGVTVELGRTVMSVREILQLTEGSVVELDRAAGALVDVLISGSVVARGEVVVVDDQLGVRIMEIIDSPATVGR